MRICSMQVEKFGSTKTLWERYTWRYCGLGGAKLDRLENWAAYVRQNSSITYKAEKLKGARPYYIIQLMRICQNI